MALEVTELRTLASVEQGGAPGPESSILKIRGTEISQRISDLTIEAYGYYGAAVSAAAADRQRRADRAGARRGVR